MSNIAPKKVFIVFVFNINQTFWGFLNLLGNSMYETPDNGLFFQHLLIQLSNQSPY